MSEKLSDWHPCPLPDRRVFDGQYVRIEPLQSSRHAAPLFQASSGAENGEKFQWLPEQPPVEFAAFQGWVERAEQSEDPMFSAVIDKSTGQAAGRQSLMRMDPTNGVIEIGNIYWGPGIAGCRGATEALYLSARHVFDDLGYRRFEWKCNNDNDPSKKAATRFGFQAEGVFRQHMIVKGQNRDTAWFAMLDKEWPALKAAFQAWLDPENFDALGHQRRKLATFQVQK